MTTAPVQPRWDRLAAAAAYNLDGWASGYFSINEAGNVAIHPEGPGQATMDLKALVDELGERGIGVPLLLRFSGILKARVDAIHAAFHHAIDEYGYRNEYRGVYPIKVNQDRYLVERLVEYGRPHHFGLEAGSKPELLAVIALLDDEEALIVCNGYKDRGYVETALLASKLGRRIVLVVEKPSELELIRAAAERLGVRPRIGIRVRLSTRGAGHWEASGGVRSKFGLGGSELIDAIEFLERHGMTDCFELLHFHLGSQIASIRNVKDAIREAAWIYVNLVKLGQPLSYLDVGGGLGVDYDGTQSQSPSSMNYSLQEYANDVVSGIAEVCDPAGVDHPTIVTEAGRATVAHHAVLVVEVLEVTERSRGPAPIALPEDAAPPLEYLLETCQKAGGERLTESFHDAVAYRDECMSLFALGHLSLEQRALAETLFWTTCRTIQAGVKELDEVPAELENLEALLADTYFCNFSVFQSMPDAWAIGQLFPVMPLHRHDEEPAGMGVLADMTCDSDGAIGSFIGARGPRHTIDLHRPNGEPYYLACFLVGAYQEILGDLHNLFGDTHTVGIGIDGDGSYELEDVVAGDTVTEVLDYVEYRRADLIDRVRRAGEAALRAGRMSREEARGLMRAYEAGLNGYTYLEP